MSKLTKRQSSKRSRQYDFSYDLDKYMEEKMKEQYGYIFEHSDIAEGACMTYRTDCSIEFKPFEFYFEPPHWTKEI